MRATSIEVIEIPNSYKDEDTNQNPDEDANQVTEALSKRHALTIAQPNAVKVLVKVFNAFEIQERRVAVCEPDQDPFALTHTLPLSVQVQNALFIPIQKQESLKRRLIDHDAITFSH
jgi:hypothetical protein